MTPPDPDWRRTNLGHLLFAAGGACIAHKLATVRAAGFEGITDAQLALFRRLDPAGMRLTTLAERAGTAKQSMIELVDRAERQGLVARSPETGDRRAKMVAPTARGLLLTQALDRAAADAERRFAAAVGAANVAVIRRELDRDDDLERLLVDTGRGFAREVLGNVHRRGYRMVTEALLTLFRTLERDGSRLTDIAAAGRITKQSMHALVERAERLGLIERVRDRADKRARIIRFTIAGLAMLDEMRRGVIETEAAFAHAHGSTFLRDLKRWLTLYLSAA